LEVGVAKWEEMMWDELRSQPETEQIITCGEWITRMTQTLLPALGRHRRETVLEILGQEGWDYTRLADSIGARRTTIVRLAEEGRATRRQARDHE
jgi:hypothetical protein